MGTGSECNFSVLCSSSGQYDVMLRIQMTPDDSIEEECFRMSFHAALMGHFLLSAEAGQLPTESPKLWL